MEMVFDSPLQCCSKLFSVVVRMLLCGFYVIAYQPVNSAGALVSVILCSPDMAHVQYIFQCNSINFMAVLLFIR